MPPTANADSRRRQPAQTALTEQGAQWVTGAHQVGGPLEEHSSSQHRGPWGRGRQQQSPSMRLPGAQACAPAKHRGERSMPRWPLGGRGGAAGCNARVREQAVEIAPQTKVGHNGNAGGGGGWVGAQRTGPLRSDSRLEGRGAGAGEHGLTGPAAKTGTAKRAQHRAEVHAIRVGGRVCRFVGRARRHRWGGKRRYCPQAARAFADTCTPTRKSTVQWSA